jgi:hypothetical protein
MPSRNRLWFLLVLVLGVVLCVLVPGLLYVGRVALREMRVIGWLLVVIAALLWLLLAAGRRK